MSVRLSYKAVNLATIFLVLGSIVTGNIVLCRLAVLSILLLCITLSRAEQFVVSPMLLFCITPLSLLIYTNLGEAYMVALKPETWIIAIINMYAFIMTFKYTSPYTRKSGCVGNINVKSLEIQSVLFFLLSLTGHIFHPIASIVWMFSVVSIVCALKTRKKTMLLFAVAIFLVSALGVTSKSTMLTYCIAFIICFEKYYVPAAKRKKWTRIALTLGVMFMIFSFSFANKDRGSYDSEEGVAQYESTGIQWDYSAGLFMPYMYLTNGWTNLQYVLDTQDSRTYGLWTIKPLLGYIQMKDMFKNEYKMTSYSTFNTFSYMTYGFKDFGYWLSVMMSVFLGFFVKRVYSRYCISKSPYDVASFILVAQATLELFFSNHFFTQSYPFTIVILMAIIKFLMSHGNNSVIELEQNK